MRSTTEEKHRVIPARDIRVGMALLHPDDSRKTTVIINADEVGGIDWVDEAVRERYQRGY